MQKDIKEYLREFAQEKRKLRALHLQLETLEDLSKGSSATKISDMPKSNSFEHSSVEDFVCEIVNLEKRIQEEESKLQRKQVTMLAFIGRIQDADEQEVLISRYFHLYPWKDIAGMMGYSISRIYKLHGSALESLRRITATEDVA